MAQQHDPRPLHGRARNDGDRVHRINSAQSSAGICTATMNAMPRPTAR
jgi:hypothetical protein